MVPWIETEQHWIWVGNNVDHRQSAKRGFESGASHFYEFVPDLAMLERKVSEILFMANSTQKEVKSIVPLQGARAQTYGIMRQSSVTDSNSYGWGLGYGFGASYTGGVLVVLQQTEYIPEEKYQEKLEALKHYQVILENENKRNEKSNEISRLERELENLHGESGDLTELDIREEKGMLSSSKFYVGEKKFDFRIEAKEYLTETQARSARIRQRVAQLTEDIETLKREQEQM